MSPAATIGLSNGMDSNAGKKYSTREVGEIFLTQYYITMKQKPEDLWSQYTLGSCFAHADGIPKKQDQGILPLEPVRVEKNPLELQEVIQNLGYAGCEPAVSCFDVTGDTDTGMLILVSGIMSKKGEAPMEFCQTFYLKKEISKRGNYVVEQDILRYNKLSNEILPTAMTPSVPSSEQNKKNVATKNPVSPVISVSDVTESEVLSNKANEEEASKPVSGSFKEEKEQGEITPKESEEDQEEDEEVEMDSNSNPSSKANKEKEKKKKTWNKKKKTAKKDGNAMEETKVSPTLDSNPMEPSTQLEKPKSFRDAVGKPIAPPDTNTQGAPKTGSDTIGMDATGKEKGDNGITSTSTSVDADKDVLVTSSTADEDEDMDGFKSRNKTKQSKPKEEVRSVHIKFTDDNGVLSTNTENQLIDALVQFGKVVRVTSNYPQYAFVDFTEAKAAIAALQSTQEFGTFKIQSKTQKRGGKNGYKKGNNNRDGQNKGNNGNGQNGNRRGPGANGNRFKRDTNGKTSN